MDEKHVVSLCHAFQATGLPFWLDGGWGVDALLGTQTRPHSDLDLAVRFDDLPAFEVALMIEGYVRADRPGDPEWNWVFKDRSHRAVDFHGFVLDHQGNGVLGDPAEGTMYPAGALDGLGMVGGVTVRCISAPFVLYFRNSFEPRIVDRLDVTALCARFYLEAPSRFRFDER